MKIFRRTFVSFIGATMLAGPGNADAQDQHFDLPAESLDELFRASVGIDSIPGMAATVVTHDRVLYQGAFGKRRLGSDVPLTLDSVFRIASMTKPIVSAAALQLAEDGLLGLDAPARDYVPEIADCKVLEGWTGDGQPRLRSPSRDITVRHLLTHTSGFGYPMWSDDVRKYKQAASLPEMDKKQSLKSVLAFDPGEGWQYGISTDWLGLILEAVVGKTLGEVLQERIFDPLQMRSTGFRFSRDMQSRVVAMHQRTDSDALTATDFELDQNPEFESGGGGLYSTLGDYTNFLQMILGKGSWNSKQVLQPESLRLMTNNAIGEMNVNPLLTVMPQLSNDVDFLSGINKKWSLGFLINEEDVPGRRKSGSLCWAGLTNCYFWIDPASGIGGMLLAQILPFGDRKVLPLFRHFEQTVYAHHPGRR